MKRAAAIALALLALLPSTAMAHAELVSTSPERGARLDRSPERVTFRFNEPVEASFGAVRVFDASGGRVDTGELERPGGDEEAVSTRLDGLPEGTYTATYRVVSADSHPVAGGFVFTVGQGGPVASATVAELIEEGDAGPVTTVAFGAVRGLAYAAIALAVGGAAFLVFVWRPGLAGDPSGAFGLAPGLPARSRAGAGGSPSGRSRSASSRQGSGSSCRAPTRAEQASGRRSTQP